MGNVLPANKPDLTQEDGPQDKTLIDRSSLARANGILAGWGTARFTSKNEVVIHIQGASKPVVARPGSEFLIGRSEKGSTSSLGLDLAPYEGWRRGVSRVHARLHHDKRGAALRITDLNSTNGTYLNERPLSADTPTQLRDGDMIRLGDLTLRIYFR
jgi:pSer/pThr/pTyr-binding forkhead associated (FHA) protein